MPYGINIFINYKLAIAPHVAKKHHKKIVQERIAYKKVEVVGTFSAPTDPPE